MYIDYANSHKHALLFPVCEWLEILARRGGGRTATRTVGFLSDAFKLVRDGIG
jgi:hypothetical protein